MTFTSERELEHFLSTPSEEDVAMARRLDGDVVILGAGGKMGPTLALRVQRAIDEAGGQQAVYAVSRFSDQAVAERLDTAGLRLIHADLLEARDLRKLPDAENVLYLAGRKFGSAGNAAQTWAMNAILPGKVAERYARARIVALSSGNIYPFARVNSKGCDESTPPGPVGEYAQSVLARERVFEYYAQRNGTAVVLVRLNYAVEPRYGVLVDVGRKVLAGEPVDVTMPAYNAIWQGDANSVIFRALEMAAAPAEVLNLTGPETLLVRDVAAAFGEHFGKKVVLRGEEAATALLNDASRCHGIFGLPKVDWRQALAYTAEWLLAERPTHGKPTHFEARDGRY